MYAQELFVHNGGKWQGAERVHARFVNLLRVFVLALQLEGEIVCEMPAFMVSSQEPQGVGIPNLKRP